MARLITPLVPKQIDNARPKDKPYTLFDGGGLYLEITPSGSKLWKMKCRINNKAIKLAFGKYPAVSLKEARLKREEAQKLIASGIDPRADKAEKIQQEKSRTEHTFEKVARDWHKNRLSGWKENTAKDIINRLEKDIFPEIGHVPIAEVTHKQLIDTLRKIEDRGAFEIAKRLKANVARIFSYAIQYGITDRNIANDLIDILKPAPKGHFAAITPDELPEFVRALDQNKARLYITTRIAIQLMMLTFIRTSELIEAEWSEIDLDKKTWIIPWQRMKMGKKKINPDMTNHRIDLSRQAVELLNELKTLTGNNQYLFPNQRVPRKPMSNGAILMALKRMGYHGRMTGHGFRSLAASTLEEMGYRREVIDRQLAHKQTNKIQAAYFRADFVKERRKMMQDWADHIDSLRTGKIIPLKRA